MDMESERMWGETRQWGLAFSWRKGLWSVSKSVCLSICLPFQMGLQVVSKKYVFFLYYIRRYKLSFWYSMVSLHQWSFNVIFCVWLGVKTLFHGYNVGLLSYMFQLWMAGMFCFYYFWIVYSLLFIHSLFENIFYLFIISLFCRCWIPVFKSNLPQGTNKEIWNIMWCILQYGVYIFWVPWARQDDLTWFQSFN